MKKPGSEGGYHIVRYLFPSFGSSCWLNRRDPIVCVYSLFLAAQRGLLLQASSTISAAAAALLALAEWFLLLLLFRRRFGLEDGYQSSPELVLAARPRPPTEPFFRKSVGGGRR